MNFGENPAILHALTRLVVEEVSGLPFDRAKARIGALSANYFSFVFPMQVLNIDRPQKFFVKIPKEDLRRRAKSIMPITSAERIMAEDEAYSLRILAEQWNSEDLSVSWVRLREFFPHYNAIVTDAVEGCDALKIFRQLDLRSRFGSKKARLRLQKTMARFGEALGRFHRRSARTIVFSADDTLRKLERYCHELGTGSGSLYPAQIMKVVNTFSGFETSAMEVPTLKGIDIRNILLDEHDRIYLMDPGRIKRTCREADLARFIMTYRILYWGSGLFFLGVRPDKKAEEAFLEAYYAVTSPPDSKLFSLNLIKEQIKHWHTAIDSLHLYSWPKSLKYLISTAYINPFYIRELKTELKSAF